MLWTPRDAHDFDTGLDIAKTLADHHDAAEWAQSLEQLLGAMVSQVAEAGSIIDAVDLLCEALESLEQWNALKDTLALGLDRHESSEKRLVYRRRLVTIAESYLENEQFAFEMARDGLLLDGPCDLLFERLCALGATQVPPTNWRESFWTS